MSQDDGQIGTAQNCITRCAGSDRWPSNFRFFFVLFFVLKTKEMVRPFFRPCAFKRLNSGAGKVSQVELVEEPDFFFFFCELLSEMINEYIPRSSHSFCNFTVPD